MRTLANTQQDCTAGIEPSIPWKVNKVEALPSFCLRVQFEDGTEGIVDMASFLNRDCGVFKSLREKDVFGAVHINHGAVTWPDELDLAPDKMHDELQKAAVYVMQ
jgi:hypothetical protein